MNRPGDRNHKSTQKSYDRLSVIYDLFTSSEGEIRQKALDLMAAKAGETILEIGFGTGHALAALSVLLATLAES
jgi:ubiquinone/menaquinone biosynthesis C-methylase UbiE